jgi:hypothetical protein
MGNTEIATMFASHELRASADGLRWAIGRAGAMAIIWVQIAKTASRAVGRTQRDVHLIKQVEQVEILGFGRTDPIDVNRRGFL